jgi:8-oxo-dGTP diphosphatase
MKTRRATWIPVVAALIRKGDLVLLGQRPPGHSLAGEWEFPGGKIELGEQPQEALERELNEELGIHANIGPLRLSTTHQFGERGIVILFYEVKFFRGEIKRNHHTELKWVHPQDLRQTNIPETNRRVLSDLLSILQ